MSNINKSHFQNLSEDEICTNKENMRVKYLILQKSLFDKTNEYNTYVNNHMSVNDSNNDYTREKLFKEIITIKNEIKTTEDAYCFYVNFNVVKPFVVGGLSLLLIFIVVILPLIYYITPLHFTPWSIVVGFVLFASFMSAVGPEPESGSGSSIHY